MNRTSSGLETDHTSQPAKKGKKKPVSGMLIDKAIQGFIQFKSAEGLSHSTIVGYQHDGLRAHVRICWPGVIVATTIAPANVHDTEAADELLHSVLGWALADRNYWKPDWQMELKERHLLLLAPFKSAKRQTFHYPHWLVEKRYRIETVFGQLVDRLYAKKVWARDAWHLTSRWLGKILSHTIAIGFCLQLGLPPLHFSDLIID